VKKSLGRRDPARYNRPAMSKRDPASPGPRSAKEAVKAAHGRPPKPRPTLAPKTFDGYEGAVKYLTDRVNIERMRPERVDPAILRLDRMEQILERLDNPHHGVKFVHVAGSKGKGSTCEMIASCLAACGYTTGLYTSPHMVDLRERIRINQEMIGHANFAKYVGSAAAAAEDALKKTEAATFFELTTAAALKYFADQAVDIAVMEVGLGGRLDSTNVVTPEVCAITAIQLEHTQILGDTLEKIAREKAGIIKPRVPVVTVPQQTPAVLDVFRAAAAAVDSPFSVLGEGIDFSFRFCATPELGPHIRVCLTSPRSEFEHFPVPLKGEHQAFNCGLALAVLDTLRARGFTIPERKVADGLARTPAIGRMEMVGQQPRVIVDGAHNPESVRELVKAIGAHVKCESMVVIFGCNADKNVPGMLAEIARGADKIIFTRAAGTPRAMDPRELHRKFVEISPKFSQSAPTLRDALDIAKRAVSREDLICVTGSFYLAGEAKKLLIEKPRRDGDPPAGGVRSSPKPAPPRPLANHVELKPTPPPRGQDGRDTGRGTRTG